MEKYIFPFGLIQWIKSVIFMWNKFEVYLFIDIVSYTNIRSSACLSKKLQYVLPICVDAAYWHYVS